jgi:two-component system NarL family response regulator
MNTCNNDKRIRILIVEDDDSYRFFLKNSLVNYSALEIVGESDNGEDAVNQARDLRPDVVLMDIGLPIINGIEATRQIKNIDFTTKIIIVTGHDEIHEAMRSLGAGASAYVRKDILEKHICAVIETVNMGAVWLDPLIGSTVLKKSIEHYRNEI